MADAKMVSEGSLKSFINNFRKMAEQYKKNYGLTKAESKALNQAHLDQATNAMIQFVDPLAGTIGVNSKTDKNLVNALNKIKGTGISAPGTFNESLNADFVSNLRKANGNRWGMELDADGTWGMYGYPDSNKIPQSQYIRGK